MLQVGNREHPATYSCDFVSSVHAYGDTVKTGTQCTRTNVCFRPWIRFSVIGLQSELIAMNDKREMCPLPRLWDQMPNESPVQFEWIKNQFNLSIWTFLIVDQPLAVNLFGRRLERQMWFDNTEWPTAISAQIIIIIIDELYIFYAFCVAISRVKLDQKQSFARRQQKCQCRNARNEKDIDDYVDDIRIIIFTQRSPHTTTATTRL